jgi:hypothetical protein
MKYKSEYNKPKLSIYGNIKDMTKGAGNPGGQEAPNWTSHDSG